METYLSEGILQFKQHVQMGWVKYQSARMGNSELLLLFLYFSNMVNRVSPKLLDLMKIFRYFGKFSNFFMTIFGLHTEINDQGSPLARRTKLKFGAQRALRLLTFNLEVSRALKEGTTCPALGLGAQVMSTLEHSEMFNFE